jgi:hypothetical protein
LAGGFVDVRAELKAAPLLRDLEDLSEKRFIDGRLAAL